MRVGHLGGWQHIMKQLLTLWCLSGLGEEELIHGKHSGGEDKTPQEVKEQAGKGAGGGFDQEGK